MSVYSPVNSIKMMEQFFLLNVSLSVRFHIKCSYRFSVNDPPVYGVPGAIRIMVCLHVLIEGVTLHDETLSPLSKPVCLVK